MNNHKILNKIVDIYYESIIPVSTLFFSANYYNSYNDEKINLFYRLKKQNGNSYIGHIIENHLPLLIFISIKSALLSCVYPIVMMDTATNYYYGKFYKQHFIYNYKHSKAYADFHDEKK